MKIADLKLTFARMRFAAKAVSTDAEHQTSGLVIILDAEEEGLCYSLVELGRSLHKKSDVVNIVLCQKNFINGNNSNYPSISLQNFRWNGVMDEETSNFLNKRYDLLISFTAEENKMADLIVSKTNAGLKVGRKLEDKAGLFDIIISSDHSSSELFVNELKKYLPIINKL